MNQPIPTNIEAAVTNAIRWSYDLNLAPPGQKLHLLICGGSATHGTITDLERARQMGVIAWCAMPTRDKQLEEILGYRSKTRKVAA